MLALSLLYVLALLHVLYVHDAYEVLVVWYVERALESIMPRPIYVVDDEAMFVFASDALDWMEECREAGCVPVLRVSWDWS